MSDRSPLEWMIERFTGWLDRRARKQAATAPVDRTLFGKAGSPGPEPEPALAPEPDADILTADPPSCIADLARALRGLEEDRHGAIIVRWSIGCACGERDGALLGHLLSTIAPDRVEPGDSDPLLGPLAFACVSCGQTTDLLDTDVHGYHAEIGRAEGTPGGSKLRGSGPGVPHRCPACAGSRFGITTRFAYWDLEEILETVEDLPLRAADLFNVFHCECVCAACGQDSTPTDFGKL